VPVAVTVTVAVAATSTATPAHRVERRMNAASGPNNLREGHSRGARSGTAAPAQKQAAARASSVVSDHPATDHVTMLLVRRWDACGASRGVPEGRG